MSYEQREWLVLECSWCGHWKRGECTKDEVADWLRVHRTARLGMNPYHITNESICPHPCGTPMTVRA